jgi:hypothetical protein
MKGKEISKLIVNPPLIKKLKNQMMLFLEHTLDLKNAPVHLPKHLDNV